MFILDSADCEGGFKFIVHSGGKAQFENVVEIEEEFFEFLGSEDVFVAGECGVLGLGILELSSEFFNENLLLLKFLLECLVLLVDLNLLLVFRDFFEEFNLFFLGLGEMLELLNQIRLLSYEQIFSFEILLDFLHFSDFDPEFLFFRLAVLFYLFDKIIHVYQELRETDFIFIWFSGGCSRLFLLEVFGIVGVEFFGGSFLGECISEASELFGEDGEVAD